MAAAPVPASALVLVAAALAVVGLAVRAESSPRQLALDYGVFVVFGASMVGGLWLLFNYDADSLSNLLRHYWLAALFGIFVLEGAMLLYFAPSESLVPTAVALAMKTDIAAATLEVYVLIIATSVVGATIGQYLLFLVARRAGREWLLERPWFRVSDSTLERFEGWFEKWGAIAIPVSNTLLFTRDMLTIPAGLAEMDDRKFVVLSALGTISFETILALLTIFLFETGVVQSLVELSAV